MANRKAWIKRANEKTQASPSRDFPPSTPDETDSHHGEAPFRGAFEPPAGFAVSAIGRHKRIVVMFAILGVLAGLAYGLVRPVTYEASATLQVGQVNPNSPGFFSYVQSSSSLATAFSRSIAAAPVLARIEKQLGLSPEKSSQRLSSEPIPLSPAFRVIATGSSRSNAINLANVAAAGVIAYENHRNSANPQAAELLSSYQEASVEVAKANAKVSELDSSADPAALLQAEAELSAARVKLKALSSAYVTTVGSEPPRVGLVSLVAGATSATNDHSSKLQIFTFIGLLVGVVAGCGVAILRESRRRRGT